MSDYVYRKKMAGTDCHKCEDGTITGGYNAVSCDTCSFMF